MTEIRDIINSPFNRAVARARDKILYEYCYDKMLERGPDVLMREVPEHEREDMKKWLDNRKGKSYKYVMFTINFKEGVNIDEMLKKIKKSLKKIWIVNYIWCLETRGFMTGLHAHIRCEVKRGKKIYRCKGEMYNTFRKLVGERLHVNIRYSNRENAFVDYVMGLDNGQPKRYAEADVATRQHLGLENWYAET